MVIKDMPVMERPREKMIRYGQEALSNAELLALIIGTGTRDVSAVHLAEDVLAMDESGLGFLGECTLEELAEKPGLGMAKACRLKAAAEIGRRMATGVRNRIRITSPEEVASVFMERLRYFREERFLVLILDSAGGVISVEEIAIGDVMSISVHPREVFSKAIRRGGTAVVFAHNHPSGETVPSEDDIATTRRLVQAGEIVGICVLDHIIIGDGKYTSMKKCNLM